jgi:hypothetical protein
MTDKLRADNEPLPLVTILNGLDDALFALRCVDDTSQVRRYRVWCARQVQHLMTDPRSLTALDVAERYADGQATDDELAAALVAASDAASVAVMAAERAAARAAAWAAASVASSDASWAAANDAAWAAASDATWVAARAAGFSAERAAGVSAAWVSAAWAEASGAELVAAGDAAWAAARAAQEVQFRIMFGGEGKTDKEF